MLLVNRYSLRRWLFLAPWHQRARKTSRNAVGGHMWNTKVILAPRLNTGFGSPERRDPIVKSALTWEFFG